MKIVFAIFFLITAASVSWASETSANIIAEVLSSKMEKSICLVSLRVEAVLSSSISGLATDNILNIAGAPSQLCEVHPSSRVGVRIVFENNQLRAE